MKVLIVDDHPLVRRGISAALGYDEKIKEIKEAGTVEEAMTVMTDDLPEVTIIDLNLGEEDGLEIVKKTREKNIATKFIIITSSSRKDDFFRAQEAGVDGYILKEAFAEDILYGFNLVTRGKKFYDPEIIHCKINEETRGYLKELSPREQDVLKEIGKGFSNIEIAQRLFISEHTVKKHVSNILYKLNLNHRTEAAIYINNISMNFQMARDR